MVIHRTDILEVKEGLILHGVNCQKVMGAGLAKAIRDKWPIVYKKYLEHFRYFDNQAILGYFLPVQVTPDLWVGNCFTQYFYGRNNRQINYEAVYTSLEGAFTWASDSSLDVIHMPKIGCNLGGGEWSIVESMVRFHESNTGIEANVYEK